MKDEINEKPDTRELEPILNKEPPKKKKTLYGYKRTAALMRLCHTIMTLVAVEGYWYMGGVKGYDIMKAAVDRFETVRSITDDGFLTDFCRLEEGTHVFYGALNGEGISQIDKEIISIARDIVSKEIFGDTTARPDD